MTSARDQLQQALGATYTLERELGGGGTAHVFIAEEIALGRRVVVKALALDVAQELSAERFAREIRLAARLQHPNIVPVLAAGVAGEMPYYTMPYIEGESLRDRIARLRPGDVVVPAEALGLLRDIARALAFAHDWGVVHRDVKPENVLLAHDAAIVADFGIAKALDVARTHGAANPRLTRNDTALGTPAYMAPEQAAGDPDSDHRADLYAFGVLAYELVAGTHPFAGRASAHALVVAHLTEKPPQLCAARPGIPPAISRLVTWCLEKDPASRPPDAGTLVDILTEVLMCGPGHAVDIDDARAGLLTEFPAPSDDESAASLTRRSSLSRQSAET